ncbi:MAG: hypothetical protein IRZ10_09055 [Thermoflavifilum sp.]|nr:hypothetical protein [Thermoflavifilum sp.]MCL6514557.1 hypothetical protein [Alicyclobacillus sp.]
MSGGWLEALHIFGCLLLTGASVKLMDDYLDADFDLCRGHRTLAARWGRATLPYALVLGMIGAALDARLAAAVLLASYAVGMFTAWREQLPTRLPAWAEIGGAIVLAVVCAGWRDAVWAIAMMAVIDWVDDLLDMYGDGLSNQFNLALRIGPIETVFLVLLALLVAVTVSPTYTMWAFIALAVLSVLSEWSTRKVEPAVSRDGEVYHRGSD